ncbi:MAG TPA: PEP/pyruvate-binding domain-containing protein [Bacteroidia bacterium]|nr:PEP/pyruvate-binding domain-containing protein [Bacteroidia bacterium]
MKILSPERIAARKNSFGGKADGLLFLRSNGFSVPSFYIIDHLTIKEIKKDNALAELLVSEWLEENKNNAGKLWAVRSSAEVEDGKERSFAGLFRTILNCETSSIAGAVLHIIEGFDRIAETGYHTGEAFEGNIILQEMCEPEFSGVGFSKDPLHPDSGKILVNLIPGLGSKLVSGESDAFVARVKDAQSEIEFSSDEITGAIFDDGEKIISRSIIDFSKQVKEHLPAIEKALRTLEERKGFPVDTEFVVANGKIYWLQVRPITMLAKTGKPDAIWDNSNIGANFPGLSLPLTISFTTWSFARVYSVMCRSLGGSRSFIRKNQHLLSNMAGGINGGLYYNVTSWQMLLWQMPFGKKASRTITKMWGAADAAFTPPPRRFAPLTYFRLFFNMISAFIFFGRHRRKYLAAFEKAEREFASTDLHALDRKQLIRLYHDLDERLGGKWMAPMLNGFFTMMTFALVRRSVRNSAINEAYPNFVNDVLFNTGDVVSVAVVREMQELLREINRTPQLLDLFTNKSDHEIWNALEFAHPDFKKCIVDYISKYGERVEEGELKFETVNYKEDHLLFIAFLKRNLALGAMERKPENAFDHRRIIRKYYCFNIFKRVWLNWLTGATTRRVRDRENMRFIRTKTFHMLRLIFREIDARLLSDGMIAMKNDSLYLHYDELLSETVTNDLRKIIAERKNEYAAYAASALAPRYHQYADEFVPVFAEHDDSSGMKGTGCCSGVVTGEVLVIDEKNIHAAQPDGKILVAKYFEPGWIGLFSRAAGLISERGSLLSHTAILCREMGKPSIVGVKGISKQLKTGDRVTMNGATGKIERTEHEQV